MVLDTAKEDGALPPALDPTDVGSATEEAASAAQGGNAEVADGERRLAPYCEGAEPRRRARASRRGLLSPVERTKSWQVAEVRGDATPYGLPHVLRRARWDPDAGRDAVGLDVVAPLGAAPAGLVSEATGVLKQGQHSAGVARPQRGPAGRIETCQIGVFVTSASRHGQVLLDRERSLPVKWTQEAARWRLAGMPQDRRFAPTPQLARPMRARAFAIGLPAPWVTGDRVEGDERRRRMGWEAGPQAQGLAVSGKAQGGLDWQQRQVKTMLAARPEEGGTRLSAGDGATGPRWYDGRRWRLVRRRLSEPSELRAQVVLAPQDTAVADVVWVAGTRWAGASAFEAAQGEGGLDHDEVRRWPGWYRPLPLALWALALLAVLRAGATAVEMRKQSPYPSQEPSSLATFKAERGRASR